MASKNLYKKIAKADTLKNKDGGYKNVVMYAPIDTFDVLSKPTGSPSALGDTKKIPSAHTFLTDEGFISFLSKLNSVTSKTETIGEDDAARSVHSAEFIVYGDSAEHLEQFEGIRNNPGIWLIKDQDCGTSSYVQFGDDCLQPTFKFEFTGNTTKEGMKEYKCILTVVSKKYFYSSTVTEKPIPAPEVRATAQQYNLGSVIARSTGSVITVVAEEPGSVFVTLATYTKLSSDTTAVALCAHLNTAINAGTGTHGYSSVLSDYLGTDDAFTVTARAGLRGTINGKNLSVNFTGGGVNATFSGGS